MSYKVVKKINVCHLAFLFMLVHVDIITSSIVQQLNGICKHNNLQSVANIQRQTLFKTEQYACPNVAFLTLTREIIDNVSFFRPEAVP